ncbi:MAG: hypothetical protein ABI212_04765 [Burkholderiaceae bacterium]
MRLDTKLQVLAGIGAVVALPLLYVGLKGGITALSEVGLAIFAASMLVTPALRLIPKGR